MSQCSLRVLRAARAATRTEFRGRLHGPYDHVCRHPAVAYVNNSWVRWEREHGGAPPLEATLTRSSFFSLFGVADFTVITEQGTFLALPLWIFNLFDTNKSGRARAIDVFLSLALFCSGSMNDRVAFVFKVFDTDANGALDRSEMERLLGCVMEVLYLMGLVKSEPTRRILAEVTDRAFAEADPNGDGKIEPDEFLAFAEESAKTRMIVERFKEVEDRVRAAMSAVKVFKSAADLAADRRKFRRAEHERPWGVGPATPSSPGHRKDSPLHRPGSELHGFNQALKAQAKLAEHSLKKLKRTLTKGPSQDAGHGLSSTERAFQSSLQALAGKKFATFHNVFAARQEPGSRGRSRTEPDISEDDAEAVAVDTDNNDWTVIDRTASSDASAGDTTAAKLDSQLKVASSRRNSLVDPYGPLIDSHAAAYEGTSRDPNARPPSAASASPTAHGRQKGPPPTSFSQGARSRPRSVSAIDSGDYYGVQRLSPTTPTSNTFSQHRSASAVSAGSGSLAQWASGHLVTPKSAASSPKTLGNASSDTDKLDSGQGQHKPATAKGTRARPKSAGHLGRSKSAANTSRRPQTAGHVRTSRSERVPLTGDRSSAKRAASAAVQPTKRCIGKIGLPPSKHAQVLSDRARRFRARVKVASTAPREDGLVDLGDGLLVPKRLPVCAPQLSHSQSAGPVVSPVATPVSPARGEVTRAFAFNQPSYPEASSGPSTAVAGTASGALRAAAHRRAATRLAKQMRRQSVEHGDWVSVGGYQWPASFIGTHLPDSRTAYERIGANTGAVDAKRKTMVRTGGASLPPRPASAPDRRVTAQHPGEATGMQAGGQPRRRPQSASAARREHVDKLRRESVGGHPPRRARPLSAKPVSHRAGDFGGHLRRETMMIGADGTVSPTKRRHRPGSAYSRRAARPMSAQTERTEPRSVASSQPTAVGVESVPDTTSAGSASHREPSKQGSSSLEVGEDGSALRLQLPTAGRLHRGSGTSTQLEVPETIELVTHEPQPRQPGNDDAVPAGGIATVVTHKHSRLSADADAMSGTTPDESAQPSTPGSTSSADAPLEEQHGGENQHDTEYVRELAMSAQPPPFTPPRVEHLAASHDVSALRRPAGVHLEADAQEPVAVGEEALQGSGSRPLLEVKRYLDGVVGEDADSKPVTGGAGTPKRRRRPQSATPEGRARHNGGAVPGQRLRGRPSSAGNTRSGTSPGPSYDRLQVAGAAAPTSPARP